MMYSNVFFFIEVVYVVVEKLATNKVEFFHILLHKVHTCINNKHKLLIKLYKDLLRWCKIDFQ